MTMTTITTAPAASGSSSQGASGLPMDQLGATIRSHVTLSEKYEGKAHENRMAAGLHLIEAKDRIAAGEYVGGFVVFLLAECRGMSSSRAYELIAIAGGKTTQEDHRQSARARDQAYRDRKAARESEEACARATEQERAEQAARYAARAKERQEQEEAEALRRPTDSAERDVLHRELMRASKRLPTEKLREALRLIKTL